MENFTKSISVKKLNHGFIYFYYLNNKNPEGIHIEIIVGTDGTDTEQTIHPVVVIKTYFQRKLWRCKQIKIGEKGVDVFQENWRGFFPRGVPDGVQRKDIETLLNLILWFTDNPETISFFVHPPQPDNQPLFAFALKLYNSIFQPSLRRLVNQLSAQHAGPGHAHSGITGYIESFLFGPNEWTSGGTRRRRTQNKKKKQTNRRNKTMKK